MTTTSPDSVVTKNVLYEFGMELTETILQAMQRMFDEQDRKNDAKFATNIELKQVESKVDRINNTLIEVWNEIKTMREEQIVGGYHIATLNDKSDNHESRILTLEKKLNLT